ncbi:MAG: hypothetical protein K2Y56_11740 [Methylobacterium sp.]|uniref:hypothetical protein n=1 Tax=Methylobacterium sp. TaxID=409 RepID=UPI0025D977C7|nr:hypothetical protein [Methylobacterium sp.]MBX9932192.1 hypothetical protein [Methylobacterium sp.]
MAGPATSDEPTEGASATLPEPVRDHLGQQLRAVFTADDGVPNYLGEPVVPEVFEPQIERLEVRLKTHEEGTDAVAQALDDILGDLAGPQTRTTPQH